MSYEIIKNKPLPKARTGGRVIDGSVWVWRTA